MKTFIIATNNKGKLAEMSRILGPLGISAMSAAQAGITLDDVEETGETFAENAFIKAKAASCKTGLPAVADDSGLLVVPALPCSTGCLLAKWVVSLFCVSKIPILSV